MVRESRPRARVGPPSDLVFIPVKGSHVAALAMGWLGLALASAALGAASVARVGLGVGQPQSQITVSRPASPLRALPPNGSVDDFEAPAVAPARAEGRTVSVAPFQRPSPRSTSPAAVPTGAPSAATRSGDLPVIVLPPSSGAGSGPTLGVAPTATPAPSSTSPGKGSSKKWSGGRTRPPPEPSVLLASWTSADGGPGAA